VRGGTEGERAGRRILRGRLLVAASALLLLAGALGAGTAPGSADGGPDLWVDGASATCSDGFGRQQAVSPETPWCSVARAAGVAVAGDIVRILPATYVGTVRPAFSGTPGAPIRYVAPLGGVTIDGGGASASVKVVSVTDVAFEGIGITGATVQGVWAYQAQRITLDGLTVRGNGGPGIQLRESASVAVSRSRIEGNGGAGIFESTGSSGGRYVDNQILGNGIDGQPYNGDGLQLGGAGALVAGNTVVGNGDAGPFEHGIYAAASARDVLIEGNVVNGNAGSNVKAAGAGVVVRYNRLEGGRLGLVLSDNETPVTASYNLIFGSYQHGIFLTVDKGPARARLWNNTVVVTSRNAPSGDASAIFVRAAAQLDLRNNIVSYANRDNAGSALYVLDDAQLQGFTSNNNWFSTFEAGGKHLVWDGARVPLAKWQRTGQDQHSLASPPPGLDADARVVSANLGRGKGQPLGLLRDYAGVPVPTGTLPDIGAYQTP
jgi:hypothetical protein